ncbi:MAG: chemotaxis protein CheV [candidate division Zixibacteria bacterium]|nr:chemotaxis protein CheV [candidate division Zixibacteria bacterium]
MNMKMDAESYLKSGSNELRILEYSASGLIFGINILKVSKIVSNLNDFTQIPETHPAIKGVFKDMGQLIPLIDLSAFLGITNEDTKSSKVIVTEFFGILTGLWVDQINWLHHFKWEDVIDAEKVFRGIDQRYTIGIVRPTEELMVQLLDYETILLDLCPHLGVQVPTAHSTDIDLSGRSILIAEDSPAVRAMLQEELTEQGCKVKTVHDGAQGWEVFQTQKFDLVICDVEMPQMDGLALTLKIRQSEEPSTPVIVYSSIGDIGMKSRAEYLKADAHITKLNLDQLMQIANKLMRGEKLSRSESGFDNIKSEISAETVPID